jgi:hypothetical protein
MENVMIRLLVGIVFALSWLIAAPASAQSNSTQFKLCPASNTDEFADCTFAQKCTFNKDGTLNCPDCKVRSSMTSVVLATDGCASAKNGPMQSRFPGTGLQYMELCGPGFQQHFQKTWASCLGAPCKNTQGTTTSCTCKPATDVPYVAARKTNSYDASLCTTTDTAISSATEEGAFAIQKFLGLPPPVVVNHPEAR